MQILDSNQIPYLTAGQMLEVDRLMVDEYGIQLIQIMENASRHLAALVRSCFIDGNPFQKKVLVLVGGKEPIA